jgi:hypothetical protein
MAPLSSSQSFFTVKSDYNGDIRRFTAPGSTSFEELAVMLCRLYALSGPVTLKYTDEDGDMVTMASSEDLMRAVLEMAGNALRVHVLDESTSVDTTTAIAANVPVSANVVTNAPETVVPVVASPVTTVPISDISTQADSPASGNVVTAVPIAGNSTNVSPIVESPITTTTFSDSPITTNVVNISGVDMNVGNGNVDAEAQVFPFVNVANLNTFMPFLYQLQQLGFRDTKRHVDLLNHFKGNYLQVLSALTAEQTGGRRR